MKSEIVWVCSSYSDKQPHETMERNVELLKLSECYLLLSVISAKPNKSVSLWIFFFFWDQSNTQDFSEYALLKGKLPQCKLNFLDISQRKKSLDEQNVWI